jgi:lipopolysaccharide export system protein LptA
MASSVSRLRRWFALGAVLMIALVAGMYFYAQWRLRQFVHTIPAKLGIEIQQTAEGFSISKSEAGRTQFTVSASKAVQFKQGGRAELHNVKIVVYGKDASRFDRITGDDFEYDPASGEVSAKGRVLIDLEANPEGMRHSDQSPPDQAREPLHLETDGLVFNKNTGDASASGKVEFETPQASGSAVGIQYVAQSGTLSLLSAIAMTVNRPQPVHVNAERGVITKEPRRVVLTGVQMTRELQQSKSGQATFFLRADNTVDHILAEGGVETKLQGRTSSSSSRAKASNAETVARSDRTELFLTGTRNLLTTAVLTGNVNVVNSQRLETPNLAAQPVEASAGRATLHFGQRQALQTVHAEDGVRLTQKNGQHGTLVARQSGTTGDLRDQDVEMTAPAMDFIVKNGRILERAETSGPPQITIMQPSAKQKTVASADKFTAKFTDKNRLATLHGEPNARIVSSAILDPGKLDPSDLGGTKSAVPERSDRVSTSQTLDVMFLPEGGVRSITQTGNLTYVDGAEKAWAQRGEYTTSDQSVVLTGSPRVQDGGMTTTAQTVRISRATGDASAEGNVKSTYSDLKAQPDGALLASSDPIHVTSRSMTAHRSPAVALYTGDARLWQNANVVEAPRLQFDRDHRSIVAEWEASSSAPQAHPSPLDQPVSTVLVQVDKTGKATPVHITSGHLKYADVDRKIFLDGGVTAKEGDVTMTGEQMTVFLLPRSQSKAAANPATPGQVEKVIAENKVVITQPTRHATCDRLVYTSADDKFVLTGGPPSIFDAERGKTTGDSLTFFRHDDRVLVEGRETSPAVTRTEVAR